MKNYTVIALIEGTEKVDVMWYDGDNLSKAIAAFAQAATDGEDHGDMPESVRYRTLSVRMDIIAQVPNVEPVLPWVVIDMERVEASTFAEVGRFATHDEAAAWLGAHPDQDKVLRGGFGLDGPGDDTN